MAYFLNPKRKITQGILSWILLKVKIPIMNIGSSLGFINMDYSYVTGDIERVNLSDSCSTANTLFNATSGNIKIGDDTIFGHNCMVLTGRHRFYKGRRAKLVPNSEHYRETPTSGFDIEIGKGCSIGSGVIILAPVTIGDNVIIAAGAVVTKDIPSGSFAGGIPAKVISYHDSN